MVEDADADLVRACQGGSRQAFERLLSRYEKPVFNVALRILNDWEDARDVTQTVFLKAYENVAKYDEKYRFFSWIYRIAVNESINQLNRRNRVEPVSEEPGQDRRDPEEAAGRQQLSDGIQEALMAIKSEYRTVIVLRHFVDCSYRDMAAILGIPEKTVKSRLFTARHVLRDLLKERDIL